MTDEEKNIIENFINKNEPIMEFHEIQIIVKMIYEIYQNENKPEEKK